MSDMFFQGWNGILRVAVVGALAYVALVAILRISGKRTLSKMNAFDFVVTVALGSTLATILLSKDVALAEGVAALGLLVALQLSVAWLSVRWPAFRRLVKSQPSLLYFRGEFLGEALRTERVTREEIHAAVRAQGIASLDDVEAVVLETDGTVTVLHAAPGNASKSAKSSALRHVKGSRPESPA